MSKFFDDLSALRVDPMTAVPTVKNIITKLFVGKPNKHWFFRIHPSPEFSLAAYVFKDKSNHDETYFVAPNMHDILPVEWTLVKIYTGVNRQNTPFLWPVTLPDANGRSNSWNDSAHKAAQMAMEDWIRLQSDQETGCYKVALAEGKISDPVWPNKIFSELLDIGFAGRIIDTEDHAIVRQLRGL